MFGYIRVNEQELKIREYTAYRSYYCGLCRNLHVRYGRTAQMMLNYDLTFLAILHTGLYEPETEKERKRCILHPVRRHDSVQNEAVAYAADMCVLLSYQKLLDDWRDDRKYPQRAAAGVLKKSYKRLEEQYPRQAEAIEKNIRLLSQAEQEKAVDIDYVSGLTGKFLEEIFVWKEDIWEADLRRMGFFLGKFIYLLDAIEDVEKDRKKENYNLFSEWGDLWQEEREKELREMLTSMMAEASRSFERLPILENAGILRNILYSGVWCRYAQLLEAGTRKDKKERASREEV